LVETASNDLALKVMFKAIFERRLISDSSHLPNVLPDNGGNVWLSARASCHRSRNLIFSISLY